MPASNNLKLEIPKSEKGKSITLKNAPIPSLNANQKEEGTPLKNSVRKMRAQT